MKADFRLFAEYIYKEHSLCLVFEEVSDPLTWRLLLAAMPPAHFRPSSFLLNSDHFSDSQTPTSKRIVSDFGWKHVFSQFLVSVSDVPSPRSFSDDHSEKLIYSNLLLKITYFIMNFYN